MGEWIWTEVSFSASDIEGGKAGAEELLKRMDEACSAEDYAVDETGKAWIQGETSYGNGEEWTGLLPDVPFRRICDSHYEYDGEEFYYHPEHGERHFLRATGSGRYFSQNDLDALGEDVSDERLAAAVREHFSFNGW